MRNAATPDSPPIARFALALLGPTALVALLFLPPARLTLALAQLGGGGGEVGVSPEAGSPYPWEAGMPVSPYSTVNLFNGNLLTEIELVEPRESIGVPFRLILSHNSAGGLGTLTAPQGALFPIGKGWNITYGGCIIYQPTQNKAHVVEDDGLLNTFTWNGSQWVAPTGVFDRLVAEGANGAGPWRLTRKNQWQRKFSADGLFEQDYDSNLSQTNVPVHFVRDSAKLITEMPIYPDYASGFKWDVSTPPTRPPRLTSS